MHFAIILLFNMMDENLLQRFNEPKSEAVKSNDKAMIECAVMLQNEKCCERDLTKQLKKEMMEV